MKKKNYKIGVNEVFRFADAIVIPILRVFTYLPMVNC